MERMKHEEVAAQVRKQAAGERSVRCAVCATECVGSLSACTVCGTTYHSDCWSYNGGCAVYGCKAAPRAPEPLHIDVAPARPSRPRQLMLALGAAGCLLVGVLLGERNAAARLEDVDPDEDFAELACTVEVFEGLAEIETLRIVPVRCRKAREAAEEVARTLMVTGDFPVKLDVDEQANAIEVRGPERMVATVQRKLRELDVATKRVGTRPARAVPHELLALDAP